ncbi:maternal embryonic leucine zipper kinase-like protein, partial [Dinothrombium tinctorium]
GDLRALCVKWPHHGEDLSSELKALSLIGPHKHVCQMEYFINSPKGIFLIFERHSSSLSSYFAKLGRIDARQAMLIFAQIHLALSYVHSLGYVHHDVKPDNILITTSGNVKLADFGLLNKMQKDAYAEYDYRGTRDYFAPECFKSKFVSSFIDYWALTVSIMELYYGLHPFEHPSTPRLTKNNILYNAPYYSIRNKPLHTAAEHEFFLAFLEKNPDDRPNPPSFVDFAFFSSFTKAGFSISKMERGHYGSVFQPYPLPLIPNNHKILTVPGVGGGKAIKRKRTSERTSFKIAKKILAGKIKI